MLAQCVLIHLNLKKKSAEGSSTYH